MESPTHTQGEVAFDEQETRDDEMHSVVEEWIADLKRSVERASESTTFKHWLDVQSTFHDYSARNSLLIALQCPDATRVAGYRAWQDEFDRQVSKGESAIWIWAPISSKTCPECGKTKSQHGENCSSDGVPYEEWPTELLSFKPVPVFDVSQTEGEPLPELDTEARGDAGELLEALCEVADSFCLCVSLIEPSEWTHGTAAGVCEFTEDSRPQIEVKRVSNDAGVAMTLVHEIAHGLLHSDRSSLLDRAKREVEAEAVAYIVGRYFELDMSGSAFYLAAWSSDDPDMLLQRLNRIRSVASKVINSTTLDCAERQNRSEMS